jgi:hypothetical protein
MINWFESYSYFTSFCPAVTYLFVIMEDKKNLTGSSNFTSQILGGGVQFGAWEGSQAGSELMLTM